MSEFYVVLLQLENTWTDLVVYAEGREPWYSIQYGDDHSSEVTRLWTGVQILARVTDFFILQNLKTYSRAYPISYSRVTRTYLCRGKAPRMSG
jgi:hypothetical protein